MHPEDPAVAALQPIFDAASATYFERVLPCFLTAHLRGGGYTLLAKMMYAHDADDLLSICETVTPSAKSLKRALRVRAQCPPQLATGGSSPSDPVVTLGLFQRRAQSIAGEMVLSYREIDVSWEVRIFADAFAATTPPERWADAVLLTLFHEYIHYFESFLLRSEQPLRSREEGHHGIAERALTLEEAQRRDRRVIRRRRLFWGVALAIPLIIATLAILNSIDFETERDREGLRHRIAGIDGRIAKMQNWVAPEAAGLAAAHFTDDMATYKKVRSTVSAACGLDDYIGRRVEIARGSGDPERCILAVEAARPWVALQTVRVTPEAFSVQIGLPTIVDRRPHLGSLPKPNTVTTEDGRALRAQLIARRETAQALRDALEPTAKQVSRPMRRSGPESVASLVRALRQDGDLRPFSVFWNGPDMVEVRSPRLGRWYAKMNTAQTYFTVPGWGSHIGPGKEGQPVTAVFYAPRRH